MTTESHDDSSAGQPVALGSTDGLGRCATCKHWTRYEQKFDREYHGAHAGLCRSQAFDYGNDPGADGLAYWDFEGYSAGFNTGESFGCVHWAAA